MGIRMRLQATKIFCILVLLASVLVLECPPRAKARTTHQKWAKKPKGTIKTIKGDTDIIDCVDIHKQPAFDHPLLKNHGLQMQPDSSKFNNAPKFKHPQEWHKHGECPKGTIPIKRQVITGHPIMRKNRRNFSVPAASNSSHQYSIVAFNYTSASMQGATAEIDIWDPSLAIPASDFSLSQIWIVAGDSSSLQTIEAGWQVYPGRTGDSLPRLFVYWTADGYNSTGCYDLTCPGFVQTNNTYALGAPLTPSTYNGNQSLLVIDIERDQGTGNWGLFLWGTAIGYWPASIYGNGLLGTSGASSIEWGGEIFDSSGSNGFHSLTQMGSGYLAEQGLGKASFVRLLQYTDPNGSVLIAPSQSELLAYAPAPSCYDYQFQNDSSGQLYFFYGGPGCT
ncbi:hypothetical protein Ancab_012377 [Ancistrocladus abbreviatus]